MPEASSSGRDRRRAQRVALRADVDFESNDNFFSGQTRDISSGGLFIETRVALPIGSELRVKLRLTGRTFDIESEVAWQLEDEQGIVGVGVQFVKVTKTARAAIQAFMDKRAPMAFDELEPDEDDDPEPQLLSPLPCPPEVPRPKPRVVPPPLPREAQTSAPPSRQ